MRALTAIIIAGALLWTAWSAGGCDVRRERGSGAEASGETRKEHTTAEDGRAPAEPREGRKPAQRGEEPARRPPGSLERRQERLEMVKEQIAERRFAPSVTDADVLEAMRRVPRHLFVGPEWRSAAYSDRPLPIGQGQTISQPYIVAYMTEKLDIEPGEKVLEIGTGSGYQAAVLSELTSQVYSIEILEELGREARQKLKRLGYDAVRVKIGDGYYGWEEHAPYDAVIVTCAAGHVPPPLLKQLKRGGRMVIPVSGTFLTQRLILITREEDGSVSREDLMPVRFVPMTGRAQQS